MDRDEAPGSRRRPGSLLGGLLVGTGIVGLLLAAVTLLAVSRRHPERPLIFGAGVAVGAIAALAAARPRWRPRPGVWLVVPAVTLIGTIAGLVWSQPSTGSDGYCVITTGRGAPLEWLGNGRPDPSARPDGTDEATACAARYAGELGPSLFPAALVLDVVFWAYLGLLVAVLVELGHARSPVGEPPPGGMAGVPDADHQPA